MNGSTIFGNNNNHTPMIIRKLIRFSPVGLITTLMCATLLSHNANSEPLSERDRASQQAELNQLIRQLKEIQVALKKDIRNRSLVVTQLSNTELKIGALAAELRVLKRQATLMDANLVELQQQQLSLDQKTKKQHALLAAHIKQAYLLNETNQLKILLNQTNPEDFDRQMNYLKFVNQSRQQQLQNYRALIEKNNQLAKSIYQKQQAIDQNKALIIEQTDTLKRLQIERRQQLIKLQSAIKSKQSAVLALERDGKAMKKLLSTVAKLTKKNQQAEKQQSVIKQAGVGNQGFFQAKGSLPWPVKGNPIAFFGDKRTNSGIAWEGITLAANMGEPIKAIFSGLVVFSDWFQGQGLLLIIDHGQGYLSLYSHNQSLLKNTGAMVVGGETIATAGNSGGQLQSGLYFEIRHNGEPQNPEHWCIKR
ncbi:MAG: peptidoglycan DD-metalloendopeptidase family protein [Pseudomonadota bacterium]|nr:peptidoglycan DD-metalloendopeptidase family protein [Pseudomonadota bacterium]